MTDPDMSVNWSQILIEAAGNVRSSIRGELLNRSAMENEELKTLLDSKAQTAIQDTLKAAGNSCKVISEEGNYVIGDGGPYIILDPVDGTTNLSRGIPMAVTSMAVSTTRTLSKVTTAIIMDLYTGEIFRAERNKGSWRGGKRMSPSGPKLIRDAMISLDMSKETPVGPLIPLIEGSRRLRQLGASALSLCYVASGMLDAHVDLRGKLRSTDVAAGLLILKEAGGTYSINGKLSDELELSKETKLTLVAASSPGTLEEILIKLGH